MYLIQSANCKFILFTYRWTKKKKATTEVWFGASAEEMPNKKVAPLVPDIFASYTGPEKGLAAVDHMENANPPDSSTSKSATNGATPFFLVLFIYPQTWYTWSNKNSHPWHCTDLCLFNVIFRKGNWNRYRFFIMICTRKLTLSLKLVKG